MNDNKKMMLQTTANNLHSLIEAKKNAMPSGFNETRFIQNCMAVLQDTKGIENCKPLSVARTLLKGAFLGLDFFQKECYAIPYGNDLQFQTDYKGEIKMARMYSIRSVKDIYAKLVREGDYFEEKIVDGEQKVDFKPIPFNDGEIKGAFAVVLFVDGGMEYEAMSTMEIEKIRQDFSKSKNSLMWTKTPGEAYKKTVLRRLTKRISKQFDSVEQSKEYDRASGMEFEEEKKSVEIPSTFDKSDKIVEAEYTEVEESHVDDSADHDFKFEPIDGKEFNDTPL